MGNDYERFVAGEIRAQMLGKTIRICNVKINNSPGAVCIFYHDGSFWVWSGVFKMGYRMFYPWWKFKESKNGGVIL